MVVMLPEPPDDPGRADFAHREFDTWDEVPGFMAEVEATHPGWRVVTFAHVEDLPLLMEPPPGAVPTPTPPEVLNPGESRP